MNQILESFLGTFYMCSPDLQAPAFMFVILVLNLSTIKRFLTGKEVVESDAKEMFYLLHLMLRTILVYILLIGEVTAKSCLDE